MKPRGSSPAASSAVERRSLPESQQVFICCPNCCVKLRFVRGFCLRETPAPSCTAAHILSSTKILFIWRASTTQEPSSCNGLAFAPWRAGHWGHLSSTGLWGHPMPAHTPQPLQPAVHHSLPLLFLLQASFFLPAQDPGARPVLPPKDILQGKQTQEELCKDGMAAGSPISTQFLPFPPLFYWPPFICFPHQCKPL